VSFRERVARITLRCYQEDLGGSLPPITVEMTLDHPLVRELERLAPTAPKGLKRILAIKHPPVFRLRHGRHRAAAWVDEERRICWLLAVDEREERSRVDAYARFERLHLEGRLLPSDDDLARYRLESAARILHEIRRQVPQQLRQARACVGIPVRAEVAGVPVRMLVRRAGELEEIWLAVSLVDGEGRGVPERLRDMVFAVTEQEAGAGLWDSAGEWPEGALEWFEVARYGLREI